MFLRICPNCNKELGNHDHYFCSNCGVVLPKDLVNDQVDITVKLYNPNASTKQDKLPFKIDSHFFSNLLHPQAILAFLFIVAFAVVLIDVENLVFLLQRGNTLSTPVIQAPISLNESTQSSQSSKAYVVDLPLSGTSQPFETDDLNQYVPAETDLYVFGNNIGTFLAGVTETNVYSDLFATIPEVLNKPFVLFTLKDGQGEDWGLVIKYPTNSALTKILNSNLANFAQFKSDGDFLVVGSNETVLAAALSAKNKDSLNILLNPSYVKAKATLQPQGLGIVIIMTDSGKKVLKDAKNYKIGNTLKNTIDGVLKTGYNEVVID
ncbi:MAG TPA: hypothetical protein VLI92_02915 [Candidatus Saccharimonadales bacterium]|nr:hypothetical protein [Candidatus Saccharimonadales bacterium]